MSEQDKILVIIKKYEAEIEKLIAQKKRSSEKETIYFMTEYAILMRQNFISDLRGLM